MRMTTEKTNTMEQTHDTTAQLYRLGELVELLDIEQLDMAVPGNGKKCMTLEDFSNQYMLSYIDKNNIGEAGYLVQWHVCSPCLLAAMSGRRLQVARISTLDGMESGVWIDRIPFFAFRIKNHNIVNEDYLLRCLVSDDVGLQLHQLAKEDEYAHKIADLIDENDLLNLEIRVPSLEQQDMLVKNDMLNLLQELMSQKQADFENYQKDIHLKKHAVGQTLFNLNNWWNTLQRARTENNGRLTDDTTTGRIRPVAVKDVYDHIGEGLNILSNQIYTFTIGDGMERERIALAPFVAEYARQHQSPLFRYAFDETGEYATEDFALKGQIALHKGDPLLYLDFPRQALTQILDNIISNACSHGFLGTEDQNNTVRITLNALGSTITMVVANNGRPLHKGMTEDKVFMYGGSTAVGTDGHNGLGAFQIRNLMSRFGGTASILCDENDEFPFAYKLTFHNCISYK